jgi:hypothetical protein
MLDHTVPLASREGLDTCIVVVIEYLILELAYLLCFCLAKQADGEAYTAGASLFLPTVRKSRDISWKQSSSTLSTAMRISLVS